MEKTINEVSIYCRCQRTPEQDRLIAALAKSTLIKRIGVYYVLLPEKQRLSFAVLGISRWNFGGELILALEAESDSIIAVFLGRTRGYRSVEYDFETTYDSLAEDTYRRIRKFK